MAFEQDIYPSRVNGKETISQRQDPVTYPSKEFSSGPLREEQINQYRESGYLVLPNYMPEMVEPIKQEVARLSNDLKGKEELYTEPDSDAVRTIFKPFAYSKTIHDFARHPKVLRAVQQILGSDAYLMQSRVNVKPAFKGKSFPWHSDFETWHVEDGMPRMRAVTAWLMLTDNTEHNGPLYVIPGSHNYFISCTGKTGEKNYLTSLKQQKLGVPSTSSMNEILKHHPIESVTGKAGTLVFHECNILHGSPDNISADPRSILMFVYNSVLNKPVKPFGGQAPRPHYLSNTDHSPLSVAEPSFVKSA
ncbi:phytanoyl-CoA dioxygenase family protein [Bermanella sp. R86510]|uniref:phytanoyl-CoA dioxygenase family protein n=1 Tax=unclassified Bermanella TaxID=2627862 RepID=UPI0037C5F9E5